jgi:hypothetical protein
MTATEALVCAWRGDATLEIIGGRLRLSRAAGLSPELRRALREHAPAIKCILEHRLEREAGRVFPVPTDDARDDLAEPTEGGCS